jgi:hypothetical protein
VAPALGVEPAKGRDCTPPKWAVHDVSVLADNRIANTAVKRQILCNLTYSANTGPLNFLLNTVRIGGVQEHDIRLALDGETQQRGVAMRRIPEPQTGMACVLMQSITCYLLVWDA